MRVIRDSQTTKTGRQESEWIAGTLRAVECTVGGASRWHPVVSSRESCLSGGVGKGGRRVRGAGRAVSRVHLAHRRVGRRTIAQSSGGDGIVVGRGTELLVETAKATGGRCEGTRGRGARHRVRPHAESRGRIHSGRESRVSHHGGTRPRSTATETVDVLGEVVISTAFRATLPVTGTEGNHATVATHSSRVTHAVAAAVAHVGRHH